LFLLYFFFFFQAEDGIRDFHVTGVQTCALPISFENLSLFITSFDILCNASAYALKCSTSLIVPSSNSSTDSLLWWYIPRVCGRSFFLQLERKNKSNALLPRKENPLNSKSSLCS